MQDIALPIREVQKAPRAKGVCVCVCVCVCARACVCPGQGWGGRGRVEIRCSQLERGKERNNSRGRE